MLKGGKGSKIDSESEPEESDDECESQKRVSKQEAVTHENQTYLTKTFSKICDSPDEFEESASLYHMAEIVEQYVLVLYKTAQVP